MALDNERKTPNERKLFQTDIATKNSSYCENVKTEKWGRGFDEWDWVSG